MKVSLICAARNKAQHVSRCVQSLLKQDYDGELEIVVSVQPSEDNTLDKVRDAVMSRAWPHQDVRVLECPVANYRGMAGLNEHLNWIHQQITGDLVISCSADDYVEPGLVREMAAAYEAYRPSYICAGLIVERPDGMVVGQTSFPEKASRHLGITEAISHLICSSSSGGWARDLWRRYGPLRGVEAQDMLLPLMAFFERGVYYVDAPLHHHVLHAGLDNTGTEGQMRAARGDIEAAQLGEVNGFQTTHHWVSIYRRLTENGYLGRLTSDAHGALLERLINAADYWTHQRADLTMRRIAPAEYRV